MRIRKIVPASRRVNEASLEPASSIRRRPTRPAELAVADCESITASPEFPWRCGTPPSPGINYCLRFGWSPLVEIDVELVGTVAPHQGQLQCRAFRVRTW